MSGPVLQLHGLVAGYGKVVALHGVSLDVHAGEITAIIGPNGAGKTTLLRCISGMVRLAAGSILWRGQPILGLPPHRIAAAGIVQVPEGRMVLKRLTARENLLVGAHCRSDAAGVARDFAAILDLFPALAPLLDRPAGLLSGGQQQMLVIGRALIARPQLLLLDEPSLGLAPLVVEEIFRIVQRLRAEGNTILLVEQNARKALRVADRAHVIELGRVVLAGRSEELAGNPRVVETYLGA